MSKYGLQVAIKYGEKLKKFKDISAAEDYFFSYKQGLLNKLETISKQQAVFCFSPDYTVGSLKKIEKWYFDLHEKNEFHTIGLTQEEFESIISVYFGEVVVRNNEDAKWLVEEYPFSPGKYEFFVNKGLINLSIINMFHGLCQMQNNKRRNLLFREYNKYFVRL